MKLNVVAAALIGLLLGIAADFLFVFLAEIPLLGCLLAPLAWLFGLGVPILIGALAVMFAPARGLSAPLDGALAAVLAELGSRAFGFCASVFAARTFFLGPRFLGVEPTARMAFAGIWSLGWLVLALVIAALLGALGAFVYAARR